MPALPSPKRSSFIILDPSLSIAFHQLLLFAALTGLVWLLAALHLSMIARPLYVLAAVLAAYFYLKRSPWQYLTFVLWLWTVSPFVRRVVDYYGGFQAANPILLAPQIATLFMLSSLLTSRRLLKIPETASGMLLLGPVLYGLAVSMVNGELFAGAVAALDWVFPLLVYFYLVQLAPRIDDFESGFRGFVALNLLIIALYGLFQYYAVPAWDLKWAMDTHILMLNHTALKPFSTLNNAGPCALWLGTLILLSMYFRTFLSSIMLPLAILFLALTEVRMTLGTVIAGLLLAGFFGDKRVKRSLLAMVAAGVLAGGLIAICDPKAANELQSRFSTVKNLKDDTSALARQQLYASAPGLIGESPLGVGIAAFGKGASIGGSGGMADFDSGVIAPFIALGWLGGAVYMFGSLIVVAQAWSAAFRTSLPSALILATAATSGLISTIFTMGVGLQGLVIWLPAGYASAIAVKTRMKASSYRDGNYSRLPAAPVKENNLSNLASSLSFN